MSERSVDPPLKALHSPDSLVELKLLMFERLSTEVLKASLAPGQANCLKARPDGTILDGHHRVHILRKRGEDVDALPREIVERTGFEGE